ncbi:isoprenylcysteine carboxylmethyltransferase family protein [Acidovorax sp. HDW3]|uniref:methyltransferase family protein n=1 Tax=Acidovorax sp. HDW3 TaxID=2714923 RepID=UPI00140E0EE4|nr:isoprenylcysteine carboxylmethyltransferase family protein [Acidovorax sp. HDW3]QIL44085.1 isoprenylcysteine carboxylmethyltransferase family protein [Acidovorax sp. HDW3]
MHFLEHKIPPPIVALACAALAWVAGAWWPLWPLPEALRLPLALPCALLGLALDGWSLWNFRRQRTTANPLAPGRASAVVQSGPYCFTRNPMYLGLALLLLALCLWRGQPLGLVALVLFVAYITRFQIQPEERALLAKFGAPYADYLRRVRRWL